MSKIYKGAIGLLVEIDLQEDISAATIKRIYVKKPDGTIVTWSATVYDTTKLHYVTQSTDLAAAGKYKLQPYIEIGDFKGRGTPVSFTVYPYFA
jgi:hypothetical protein